MGFSPAQVAGAALWKVLAAIEGFKLANGAETRSSPPTLAEHDRLMAKHGRSGSIKHG